MTTSKTTGTAPDSWVSKARSHTPLSRLRSSVRRSRIPYPLVGVLLVLACAGGFALVSLRMDDRRAVLALAHSVSAGHVLTMQDLRQVNVSADPSVRVVTPQQSASVVGKTLSSSLAAGSLLTPDAVGVAAPAFGRSVVALAVKPGQWPPELAPGSHVAVVPASRQGSSMADSPVSWPAVVTGVTNPANDQTAVVSLEVADAAARQIAALPSGQASIVMLAAGDR
jgi:hypothetical protein